MEDINKNERDVKSRKKEEENRKRLIAIIVMAGMLVTVWYMLDLVLMTFILCFIFHNLLIKIRGAVGKSLRRIPDNILLLSMYALMVGALSFVGGYFAPKLVTQIAEIADLIWKFDFDSFRESLEPAFAEVLLNVDLTSVTSGLGNTLMLIISSFGTFGLNLFLAIMLSLFLLLEKGKIKRFGEALSISKISFFYEYFVKFGTSFTRSFGTVMKVQVTIAFINCIITMIMLAILGFPQVLGLGIMVFFLGLIPVAGVVISLIPLSIVAFTIGGMPKVLAILLMIVIIHAIEAYILNPKLMSDRVSLPISFVFIILVVAEHYLKVWGLLIGVPIFIFMLNYFEVEYSTIFAHKKPLFGGSVTNNTKNAPKHARRRSGQTREHQQMSRNKQSIEKRQTLEISQTLENGQTSGYRQTSANRQTSGYRQTPVNQQTTETRQVLEDWQTFENKQTYEEPRGAGERQRSEGRQASREWRAPGEWLASGEWQAYDAWQAPEDLQERENSCVPENGQTSEDKSANKKSSHPADKGNSED